MDYVNDGKMGFLPIGSFVGLYGGRNDSGPKKQSAS